MVKDVEGTKALFNEALTIADLFLEVSNSEAIPNDIISHLQANNQSLQQINDLLLDSQFLESNTGN